VTTADKVSDNVRELERTHSMDPAIVDVREHQPLNDAREAGIPRKTWGPYSSERQWGTVREDYSEGGDA